MNNTESIPAFFKSVNLPAVAKWTDGKLRHMQDTMDVDGVEVAVRDWVFEGRFPRNVKGFHGEWKTQDGAIHRICTVQSFNQGTLDNRVQIWFKEYESVNGTPIPD